MALLSDTAENRDTRDFINPNYEQEISKLISFSFFFFLVAFYFLEIRNAAIELESASRSASASSDCSNESLNVNAEILGKTFENFTCFFVIF